MSFDVTTFLLSERDNPHSAVRANGVRFWGYPQRQQPVTCVVLHTTENNPTPTSALNVARWQATSAPSPSSYHVIVDSDSVVRTLPDEATAFHTVGLNSRSLGLSFATRASLWGRHPSWDRPALLRAAWVASVWCRAYGIPARWVTLDEAQRGVPGFIRHSTADPSRRSDPGPNFPDVLFFDLVRQNLSVSQTPEKDDDLTPEQSQKLDEVWTALGGRPAVSGRPRQKPRDVATDLQRFRLSLRAIAVALKSALSLGYKITHQGRDDDTVSA